MSFGDVTSAPIVESDGDRVFDQRFGRPQGGSQAGSQLEGADPGTRVISAWQGPRPATSQEQSQSQRRPDGIVWSAHHAGGTRQPVPGLIGVSWPGT